jgi:hypothetical protein
VRIEKMPKRKKRVRAMQEPKAALFRIAKRLHKARVPRRSGIHP